MKVSRFLRRASGIIAVAACTVPAGCFDPAEPQFALFWLGVFHPDEGATRFIGGTTEMVANISDSSVGVFLEGEPGEPAQVSWQVRNGACSGTGERIAAPETFPVILLSAAGTGTGIAALNRRVPAGAYAAEVFAGTSGTGERLACADLTQS